MDRPARKKSGAAARGPRQGAVATQRPSWPMACHQSTAWCEQMHLHLEGREEVRTEAKHKAQARDNPGAPAALTPSAAKSSQSDGQARGGHFWTCVRKEILQVVLETEDSQPGSGHSWGSDQRQRLRNTELQWRLDGLERGSGAPSVEPTTGAVSQLRDRTVAYTAGERLLKRHPFRRRPCFSLFNECRASAVSAGKCVVGASRP